MREQVLLEPIHLGEGHGLGTHFENNEKIFQKGVPAGTPGVNASTTRRKVRALARTVPKAYLQKYALEKQKSTGILVDFCLEYYQERGIIPPLPRQGNTCTLVVGG